MNLTTLKAELLEEFDEKWFRSQNGNELYPPIPFGEKEIKNFLSHALDRAIREAVVGCLPEKDWGKRVLPQVTGLDEAIDIEIANTCLVHNQAIAAARAEMITRAKAQGIEIEEL